MKKTPRKIEKSTLSLGELILTVSSFSRSRRETIAAVADLLESGRVRFESNGRRCRAHIC